MAKITGMKPVRGREKRVRVLFDARPPMLLLAEIALKEGLKKDQELTDSQLEKLAVLDLSQRCYNAAARFLAYRPRSEAEIRQRLLRHGFLENDIAKTLARLKEQGLADDAAFARYWRENRDTFSPRSRRLTKMELKRKGLSGDIIEQVISEIDEKDSAYRAATARARRLRSTDFQDFRQRLGSYLGRRGFNYGIIKEITERVWQEQKITSNSQS
jgi:regulatory protein